MSANPDHKPNFEASAASDESIREVHAKLQSNKPDKPHGYPALPLIMLGLMCCIGFFGSVYMVHNSVRFDPLVVNAHANRAKPGAAQAVVLTRAQLGKPVYMANCATCHQANGGGVPGAFPPLANSEWVTGSEERTIRIVLHGLQGPITVAGNDYNNVMAPLGGVLKDEQIANVLSYIRQEWGNSAPEVDPATVARVRAETASHSGYWTAEQLLQIGN